MEQSNNSYAQILQLSRQANADENYPALKLYPTQLEELEEPKQFKDLSPKTYMTEKNTFNLINMILTRYGKENDLDKVITELKSRGLVSQKFNFHKKDKNATNNETFGMTCEKVLCDEYQLKYSEN